MLYQLSYSRARRIVAEALQGVKAGRGSAPHRSSCFPSLVSRVLCPVFPRMEPEWSQSGARGEQSGCRALRSTPTVGA